MDIYTLETLLFRAFLGEKVKNLTQKAADY